MYVGLPVIPFLTCQHGLYIISYFWPDIGKTIDMLAQYTSALAHLLTVAQHIREMLRQLHRNTLMLSNLLANILDQRVLCVK